ncbi:Pre-rRNA-processing protein TSR2-domain-containing protein [Tirmania nivea]|nr:Pre-rRNA-processing protein TSR2-domain-containing protein [Tirmania nivea]
MSTPTPWELGIAYILHSWPALTLAVTSNWGGANSSEKRDWLCGAIADMFPPLDQSSSHPTREDNEEPDDYDVEETLAQVMQDEFGVQVEDDSIVPLAHQIIQLRTALLQGNFGVVEQLRERFEKNKDKVPVANAQQENDGVEVDDEEEDSDERDAESGVSVQTAFEPDRPVVDKDGFELVQSRRRR